MNDINQPVPVPRARFIGDGSIPFLVTGRLHSDENDTAYLVLANDADHANIVFSNVLLEVKAIDFTQTNNFGEVVDDDGRAVDVIFVSNICLSE